MFESYYSLGLNVAGALAFAVVIGLTIPIVTGGLICGRRMILEDKRRENAILGHQPARQISNEEE